MLRLKKLLVDLKMPLLAIVFVIYTLAVLMHEMLFILFDKTVLQIGESHIVDLLYSLTPKLPALMVISASFFILGGFRIAGKQRIFWGLVIASGAIALIYPVVLYFSIFCFLGYIMSEKKLQAQCDEDKLLSRVPVNFLGNLFLMFSIALLLCAFLEITITIAKYSGKLFSQYSFLRFLATDFSLCLSFSFISTLLVAAALQILLSTLWLSQKFCKMSKNTAIFSFLLFHMWVLAILAYILVRIMFDENIQALHFEFSAPLLILLPVTLLFALSWVSLCKMSNQVKIASAQLSSLYHEIFLATGLCLFIPFIGAKKRKLHLPLTILTYSLTCAVLVYLNYPEIADLTDRFCLVLSFMVIVSVSIILFLLCRQLRVALPRRVMWAAIVVLIAIMPLGLWLYKYQSVRMIVLEYSKLSFPQLIALPN